MLRDDELAVLEAARVGRLATADAEGRPHVVPVCFALVESEDGRPRLVTPIDEKPKSAGPRQLRRVRDIETNPQAAVVVDRYTEDWDRLGWIQIRGRATVIEPGDDGHADTVRALRGKYHQYADHALEDRPAIVVGMGSVRSWGDIDVIPDR